MKHNPVAMKKIDPYTLSLKQKYELIYSID